MQPNVLVVVLDSVRAQNCSLYGHLNETTPFLESFSDESVLYTQARAPGTWSLPSHASMFTGYHVEEHRLTSRDRRLKPGHTIWETLRDDHGYETGVFARNPFVTRDTYGLNHGFSTTISSLATRSYPFDDATNPIEFTEDHDSERSEIRQYISHCLDHDQPVRSFSNGALQKADRTFPNRLPAFLRPEKTNSAAAYTEAFLKWQQDRTGSRAACINLIDAHHPYTPQAEYDLWGSDDLHQLQTNLGDHRWDFYSGRRPWWQRKALEALYDGCIRQLDAAVEHLVGTLEQRGVLDETLVVFTSDHGEGFGERSRVNPVFRVVGHNGSIHEAVLHVPLLVRYPGQSQPTTVDEPATLTRLPTVIRNCLDGEFSADDFVPDGPVLSITDHDTRYSGHMTSFDDYRSEMDLSLFEGFARAGYMPKGDRVEKQMTWGDRSAVVESVDAQNSMRVRTTRTTDLEEATSALVDRSVLDTDSDIQIDEDTKQHLQELGYA